MATIPVNRTAGIGLLATVMLVTRLFHFAFPPDASWAVFFLCGFYLYRARAFTCLMIEAVLIDYVATSHMGISDYCLSVAYVFVFPAYAALWLGGRWSARHWADHGWRRVAWLAAGVLLSVTICFLLTNSSFYWLSGHYAHLSVAGWAHGALRWYPFFLAVPSAYIGATALAQMLAAGTRPAHAAEQTAL